MLDRIFGRRGVTVTPAHGLSDADVTALKAYLSECDDLQPGISDAILDFLLTGRNPALLLTVRALPGREPRLTGKLPWVPFTRTATGIVRDEAAEARNQARHVARRRFLVESESWDADVFRRLGLVLVEINVRTGNRSDVGPGTEHAPPWFRALMGAATQYNPFNLLQPAAATGQLARPMGVLDTERCLELLRLDGVGADALIDICFGSADYHTKNASSRVLSMPGLRKNLLAAPGDVVTGLRRLPPPQMTEALGWIAREADLTESVLFDETIRLLVTGGKVVGGAALAVLRNADPKLLLARGGALLASRETNERLAGVQILGRIVGRDAVPALRARAETETVRSVAQALSEALLAIEAGGGEPADKRVDDETGYYSADGNWIEIPSFTLPPETPFPDDFVDVLRPAVLESDRVLHELYAQRVDEAAARAQYTANRFDHAGLDLLRDIAAGRAKPGDKPVAPQAARVLLNGGFYQYKAANKPFDSALAAFLGRPEVTPWHLARLTAMRISNEGLVGGGSNLATSLLGRQSDNPAHARLQSLVEQGLDVRAVMAMAAPLAVEPAVIAYQVIRTAGTSPAVQACEEGIKRALWPIVAQHLTLLDASLGLAKGTWRKEANDTQAAMAIVMLNLLPALPRRFLPAVLDAALSGNAKLAELARTALRPVKAANPMLVGMLTSPDPVRRQRAVGLLARTGDKTHIAAVRTALDREKTETVRAALLRALVALGDDISDQFSEQKLLAQAKTGLAKSNGKLEAWFPMDALPPLAWQDGRAVPTQVVRWWLVLADKIKLAGGDPLMRMTLDRLDRTSAARLGTFVLSSFIAHDTRRPTGTEAAAHAEKAAAAHYARMKRWQPDYTPERAFQELRLEKLNQYLGTATDHRGILALARHTPGGDAVQMVQAFFRDHYPRIAQCKALVECLAANPSPAALQMVLATSNRYRTAGVQKRAAELVDEIAQDNG